MEVWYAKNDELHKNKDSDINTKKHASLDQGIERIYRDKKKPTAKLLPHANNLFFRRQTNVKKLRR